MIVIHFVWIHIIINIFGSEEDGALTAADLTTCSYTTAALLRVNEKYARSTTTPPPPPQPQLKMIKKTLTMNSCCAPSTTTTTQDDVWRVVVVLDFLHRRDEE